MGAIHAMSLCCADLNLKWVLWLNNMVFTILWLGLLTFILPILLQVCPAQFREEKVSKFPLPLKSSDGSMHTSFSP